MGDFLIVRKPRTQKDYPLDSLFEYREEVIKGCGQSCVYKVSYFTLD